MRCNPSLHPESAQRRTKQNGFPVGLSPTSDRIAFEPCRKASGLCLHDGDVGPDQPASAGEERGLWALLAAADQLGAGVPGAQENKIRHILYKSIFRLEQHFCVFSLYLRDFIIWVGFGVATRFKTQFQFSDCVCFVFLG